MTERLRVAELPAQPTITVDLHPAAVAVSGPPEVLASLARLLPATGREPQDTIQVSLTEHRQFYVESRGVGNLTADVDSAVDEVLSVLNRRHIEFSPSVLHLHAGAVTRGNRTVIVSGASRSGKSTLVASLFEGGWAYLTDECVDLTSGLTVQAWHKPISLRTGGRALLGSEALQSSTLVRIEARTRAGAELFIVVLDPDQADFVHPIHPADVVHRLVDQSLDFGRRTGDLAWLGGLVARSTAVSLSRRSLEDMCVAVEALSPVHEPHDFEQLDLEVAHNGELTWHDGTEAIELAGSLILFNRETKMIITVEGTTRPMIEAINTGLSLADLDLLGYERPFVDGLVDHGFLRLDGGPQ